MPVIIGVISLLTALLNKKNILADEGNFKLAQSILVSKLYNEKFRFSLHKYLSEQLHR